MSGFDFLVMGVVMYAYRFFILKDRTFIVARNWQEVIIAIIFLAIVIPFIFISYYNQDFGYDLEY